MPGHGSGCDTSTRHSAASSDQKLHPSDHEDTDYVLCKGLMIGKSETEFCPASVTSRAMIVTILYRLAGSPAVTGEMPFVDVPVDQWYSDDIIWASQNDIIEGYGNGYFGPFDDVTREQIAAIFCRYAEAKGMNVDLDADLSEFTDGDKVHAWAVDYMEWAVAIGMMEGRSTTEKLLAPLNGTTRAETAALLYRWCEEIDD